MTAGLRKRLPSDLWIVIGLVLLAAIIRLAHVYYIADSPLFLVPTSDALEHHRAALTLSSGDWLGRTIGPYHRPQFFVYILAILFAVFGQSYTVTHVFLLACDSLAVGVWYLVGRQCFPRPAALLGALAIALHWTLVHFAAGGYMEPFGMLLFGVVLLVLMKGAQWLLQRSRGHAVPNPWVTLVVAATLTGFGVLTRPTILIMFPVILGLLWWVAATSARMGARGFLVPVVYLAIALVTISPNAIRHLVMFDLWAPLGTNSALAFHMGNRIDGWGWDVSSPGIEFRIYQKIPQVKAELPPTIEANNQFWRERNQRFLNEEFGAFLNGIAVKSLRMLNAYEIHCTQDFLYMHAASPVLRFLPGLTIFMPLIIAGGLLLTGGFVSLLARRHQFPGSSSVLYSRILLVGFIVFYLAGVVLYLDIARHRLPVIPAALLLAGWFAWLLLRKIIAARTPAVAGLVGMLLVGIVLSQLPVIPRTYYDKHERWWTQVNLGVALLRMDQPAEAEQAFRNGIEIYPEKLETWLQLSLAEEQQADFAGAIQSQKQLLMRFRQQYPEFYPIEAEIFDRLARLQIKGGDTVDAVQTARKLTALVPGAPMGRLLLAEALSANGETEEAKIIVDELLNEFAGWPPAVELQKQLSGEGAS